MKKLMTRILSVFTALSAAVCCAFTTVPVTASAASAPRVIVSIGDSYSAGEGIEPFYGQDKSDKKKVKDQDWLAHRSENAWGGMLTLSGVNGKMSKNRGTNWFFAAASGAETKHLHKKQTVKYSYGKYSGKASLDPQDKVLKEHSGKIDYVTLTIGGNDVGFAKFMTMAISSTPEELQEYINERLSGDEIEEIKANIKAYYKDVASLAGDQAAIIVAGYPSLFSAKGFTVNDIPLLGTVTVTPESAKIVNSSVEKLNEIIKSLVDECKSEGTNIYFAPVDFSGHEAYTDKPYINGVIIKAQKQDVVKTSVISAYSMHPNKSGAKVYAAAVQKVIDSIESGAAEKSSSSTTVKNLKSTIDGSTVKLSWSAVNGAESYTVYQYKNSKWTKYKTVSKTSIKLSGLKSGTTYKFMVRATVGGKLTKTSESPTIKVKMS